MLAHGSASTNWPKCLPTAAWLNVPAGPPRGLRVAAQARRRHEAPVSEVFDPRRRSFYWIEEGREDWQAGGSPSDHAVVSDGFAALTPMQTDLTALGWLASLRTWGLETEG